jgi:alpha-mannosidase
VAEKKWLVHIVPHTHWDREWYLTFQTMRLRLVGLIDRLCAALTTRGFPGRFTLDGQMVVLEDYCEADGRHVEQLRELIEQGRIHIGPWYVLSDEFIPGEESLVRNLLVGRSLGGRWGAWMAEGYLPDSFGHPAQMPQILRGFGIESALFWRGAGRGVRESEFGWEAPDGSRVLTIYMPHGYCVAAALPEEPDELIARVQSLKAKLSPYATTRHLFFPAGCDHLELQEALGTLVSYLNEIDAEAEYRLSTVPELVSAVGDAMAGEPRAYSGEWRSGEVNFILAGTLSARMYLKQRNWEVETRLYRHAEPLSCLASCLGGTDQRPALELAWKLLLQNHAHDSICGCSIDEVHDEMLERYRACDQVLDDVVQRASHELSGALDTEGGPTGAPVIVWNPCPFPRREVIEVTFPLARRSLREVDQNAGMLVDHECSGGLPAAPAALQVVDDSGNAVSARLLSADVKRGLELFTHRQPELYESLACRVRFQADVPALGLATFYASTAEAPAPLPVTGETLENRWVRVEVEERGTLAITHTSSGNTYRGCHLLVDQADAGDEYTWSPPPQDEMVRPEGAVWEVNRVGPWPELVVRYRMVLPRGLDPGRTCRSTETVESFVTSRIRLWDDCPLISVVTTMDNRCEDHLLRAVFPTLGDQPVALARAPFQMTERRQTSLPDTEGWVDRATTSPLQGVVSAGDERVGLTLAARGLPEYELVPNGDGWAVALTLLRCVGWLSRPDLERRPGDAGWSVPTPGAQCLGSHRWEYAVIPYGAPDQREESFRLAYAFTSPMLAFSEGRCSGTLPRRVSLLTLEPSSLVVTTLKPAQAGTAVALRFFNPSAENVQAVLTSHLEIRAARKARMDETPLEDLFVGEGSRVTVSVRGHEIVTLLLDVAP